MPDRELIHAREDVHDAMRYAQQSGLAIVPTAPRAENTTEPLSDAEIDSADGGGFLLFRPEWVAVPLLTTRIEAGHNAGKYVVRPNVNCAAITLYFQGEGNHAGRRRLGSGGIGYKREWLHDQANEMRPSPPVVTEVYDAICKYLLPGVSIKAGVHRYYLCKNAARLALTEDIVPPFDYIPWPPPKSNG